VKLPRFPSRREPPTRKTDPDNYEVAVEFERHRRARTVVLSVVAAGIVGLFFSYSNERGQVVLNRDNCILTQDVARTLAKEKQETADGNFDKPDVVERQLKYKSEYEKSFPPAARTCEETFPYPNLNPFD
jgi:hypothetical protein